MKMSDAEIKKALACCKELHFQDCACCPLDKRKDCIETLAKNALDLINRQQEQESRSKDIIELQDKENERLKAEIERLKSKVNRLKQYDEERDIRLHARLIATAKSEAYKEFAERLIEEKLAVILLKDKSNDFVEGFQSALNYVEEQSKNLLQEMEKKTNENA